MRVLLAIGCDDYDSPDSPDLTRAGSDADRIFTALLPATAGDYSEPNSLLLRSPDLNGVRGALRKLLSDSGPIETFTFFFAGHGCVRNGSFYMLLRDSSASAPALTALSLADVFRAIGEAAPVQTYIIIDACESGGLINDLGVLLKAESLGDLHTPGITLLATAAQDQAAYEDHTGGQGTSAILDCIEGRSLVQDHSPTLDLIEIGQQVAINLRRLGQQPVVWGLNLTGGPGFCRNPFVASDPSTTMRILVKEWTGQVEHSLREHSDKLWAVYQSLDQNWDPALLRDVMSSILKELAATDLQASFVERLGAAMLEQARSADDLFRAVEVAATLAVGLLPYLDNPAVELVARNLVATASDSVSQACVRIEAAIKADEQALLMKDGFGFSEFYYLPIRLTKILAWGTLPVLTAADKTLAREEACAVYARITALLISHYKYSLVAVSDSQAPNWCVALAVLPRIGLHDEAEEIAGMAFHSLIKSGARLVRTDATSAQILEYLLALESGDFSTVTTALERPIETLTVLLKTSSLLGLDEVFDEDLSLLDRVSFMAYTNDDYAQYGERMVRGGANLVWTIGSDIFKARDVDATWPSLSQPNSPFESVLVVLASLLYPDRTPWHLLLPGHHGFESETAEQVLERGESEN